jgi:hypothetical protein
MAYLAHLEKSVQSTTQGALLSLPEHLLRENDDNIHLSHSATLEGRIEAEQSGGISRKREDNLWRDAAFYSLISQPPLSYEFSLFDESRNVMLVFEIKAADFNLALNPQDLAVITQIWEARNVLVHTSSRAIRTDNWATLTLLSQSILSRMGEREKLTTPVVSDFLSNGQSIEQMYVLRRPTEVWYFIKANPFLIPLLKEAYVNIREYFPSSKIFLEVVTDPEIANGEQLIIFIAVDQNPEVASRSLDLLDENWWLDAMERAEDKLCITLEFQ